MLVEFVSVTTVDVPGMYTSMGCVPSPLFFAFLFFLSSSKNLSYASFVAFSTNFVATLATYTSSFSLSATTFSSA